jgi:competence protein ComEC
MSSAARQLPVWSAPLVLVALALTAGILLDRFCIVPLAASVTIALVSLLAWLIFLNTARQWLALLYLMGGVAAAGSAYHHWHRHHVGADDLSRIAERESQPARLRGVLASAPITQGGQSGPLRSFPTQETTRFVLRVSARQDLAGRAWHDAAGLAQVTLIGRSDDVTVGDEVELLGRLALPGGAGNPGEFDYAAFLRDQGITTTLTVLESDELIRVRRGWPTSLFGILAVVRGWGQRTLARDLSSQHGVASALLLGEGADMSGEDCPLAVYLGEDRLVGVRRIHPARLASIRWPGPAPPAFWI